MPTIDALDSLRDRVAEVAERFLSAYQPRKYRQSKIVRDVIWGMVEILPHELAILDSPLFQRLRGIRQTSLASLTYPCAGHSRFEHSLGCLAVADRVLRSLERRIEVNEAQRLLIRLSALLHDCTHGPFSHTSESVYSRDPVFEAIRSSRPDLFRRASASEILTYCFITCEPFRHIWANVLEQCDRAPRHRTPGLLTENDRWRIATMIVGADYNPERPDASYGSERRYLRQLINGPFDVDKLDYVARDGYYTGLSLAIDIERLLWVLDTVQVEQEENGSKPRILCVSATGATVLEQILFSKMQLYSSVYHHHKVRVAHQAIVRLLGCLKSASVEINDLSLDDPASYLCLNDADLLNACATMQPQGAEPTALQRARLITKQIQERRLPMRALVLAYPVWGDDPKHASENDRVNWENKFKTTDQQERLVAQIAGAAGEKPEDVWLDIPGPAPLQGTAQEGVVKFDDHTYLAIAEIFPIGGWLTGYQAYRTVSYIFSQRNHASVGKAAREVLLRDYGITTNDVALKLARSAPDAES